LKGGRRSTNHKTKKKKNVIKKNELIYFTMDGCPWCEKFNPTWKQLKKSYKHKLNMLKINRQQHPELVQEFGVESFPTIILHKQRRIPFEGERDIQTFKAFLKKNKVI